MSRYVRTEFGRFNIVATEKDRILVSNMEGNGYDRIITNDNSWRWTQPLGKDDVVLPWTPIKESAEDGER